MADDIVTRLRDVAWAADEGEPYADAAREAADKIDRLRQLKRYVEHRETCQSLLGGGRPCSCGLSDLIGSSRD